MAEITTTAVQEFNFNDLPDVPVFETLPRGVFLVEGVSLAEETNAEKGSTAHALTIRIKSVKELKVATSTVPAEGSEFKFCYFAADNGFSLGRIKELYTGLAKVLNVTVPSTTAVAAAVPSGIFSIVVSHRAGKLTPEQKAAGEEAKIFCQIDNILPA
jgi:hypothetical protein